ncbi:hypothetical protein AVEN_103022-1 [Araneus ventricosus]|uniref:Uncharacterized protein n=1 Tax=Araneus ventricosus TaxID=182803 RepID=A0A4Y2B7Q8_ARAVE|nr:hypothetical protein AVEN_103022-1 [Araneus ventricosus]
MGERGKQQMHLQVHEPHRFFLFQRWEIKLRSNGLSFHRFHPRFALFPVVGTGRIDVARGFRVVWPNLESLEVRICGLWSEQSRRSYGSRIEVARGLVSASVVSRVMSVWPPPFFQFQRWEIKLRSNGLSFHRFRPRFALFPVFRTGKFYVARGLVSASVVSRFVAVNSSHIKGPDGAIASVHSSAAERFAKPLAVGTARLFRPQSTSTNLEQFEVWSSHTPAVGTRL